MITLSLLLFFVVLSIIVNCSFFVLIDRKIMNIVSMLPNVNVNKHEVRSIADEAAKRLQNSFEELRAFDARQRLSIPLTTSKKGQYER